MDYVNISTKILTRTHARTSINGTWCPVHVLTLNIRVHRVLSTQTLACFIFVYYSYLIYCEICVMCIYTVTCVQCRGVATRHGRATYWMQSPIYLQLIQKLVDSNICSRELPHNLIRGHFIICSSIHSHRSQFVFKDLSRMHHT